MNQETRQCQNCKNQFTIEPEDFQFYERIQVPPPTFCPACRFQRRLMLLNQRTFYKRKCDHCGIEGISLFSAQSPYIVFCQKCWWSDDRDPLAYGREYDFTRPFFTQFKELMSEVPVFGLQTVYTTMINSEYSNIASYQKNCYFVLNSDYDEDCMYSMFLERSKNCVEMYMGDESELCYEGVNIRNCHRALYSIDCDNCVDVYFSRDLKGCSACFGCVNLRNKQYYLFNQPRTKEDYLREVAKYTLGSYTAIAKLRQEVIAHQLAYPRKYMEGLRNNNVSGDYIFNSKNAHHGYELLSVEDSKYCQFLFLPPSKDCFDVTMWGENLSQSYDCMGTGGGADKVRFSLDAWANVHDIQYCQHMVNASAHLFGCFCLRNKQYCILNKQYSKDEYEKLVPKIIQHMNDMPYTDASGRVYRYGECFPPELSNFAYNETIAQEYFPLTKDQAIKQGYRWKDPEVRNYNIQITNNKLPDHIKDVPDDIVDKIIECQHKGECNEQCTTAFKIIEPELQFYRKMNLPLPRLCPNCRHYQRLQQRNPLKLWHRKCQCSGNKSENGIYQNTITHQHGTNPCPNEFETSYSPERKEIVYCEQCYNTEVV